MRRVAALCVAPRSLYKKIPFVEAYDASRDARSFPGGLPVVAHPPCAQWSRLRGFAKPDPDLASLALFCLEHVRREGGVLEHPYPSLFFRRYLPAPGHFDCGGFTIIIDQSWFGFPTRKRTQLYISGLAPHQIPKYPFELGDSFADLSHLGKAHRSRTYPLLANWLIQIAQLTSPSSQS